MVSDKFNIIVTETSPLMMVSYCEGDVTEVWKTYGRSLRRSQPTSPTSSIHDDSFRDGHGRQGWCDDIVYE